MHHAAFSSADFQASWRAEPREFCVGCHAPGRVREGAVAELRGIGCVECHDVPAAHEVTQEEGMRRAAVGTKACGPCHDFPVPGAAATLQSTVREHAASKFASTTCESCHMQRSGSAGRDHAFSVSRNPALLARSVQAGPLTYDGKALRVSLETRGVGHRFPTGDIFRRVTVSLVGVDAQSQTVCAEVFYLNRDWAEHRRSILRNTPETFAGDTRLTDVPRELRAPCTRTPVTARLTVDYARGSGSEGGVFTAFDTVEILDVSVAVGP